jgi:4-amino-4-deoxy-L-arabinose transferase-like glycosyltransferase
MRAGKPESSEQEASAEVTAGSPRSSRSRALASASPILLLTLFALILRLWGITWGLPDQTRVLSYHPDEGVNLVQGVLENGNPRPHLDIGFYNYGAFYFYLWQGGVAVNRAYGAVSLPPTGQPDRPSPESPAAMILVGRLLSAALGAATVWAVFALGARLFGARAGLLAAAFQAVLPVNVVHGHYATVDVPATFFVVLCLVHAAKLLHAPSGRAAALAGLFAGLAAAAKYNVALVVLAPLAALLITRRDEGRKPVPLLLPLLASTLAAFLVGNAGMLLNWQGFVRDFTSELTKSGQGMGLLFAETGNGWWYHLAVSLRYGLGLPMLLLALAGLIYAAARRQRQDIALLAFLLPYYLVIGWAQVRFLRYVVPICPVLAVLAARAVAEAFQTRPPLRWPAAAVGAVAGGSSLLISMAMLSTFTTPDARDLAKQALLQPDTEGRSIGFVTLPWFHAPPLDPLFTAPSPASRRQAALAYTQAPLLIPAQDTEWDPEVLARRPDRFAVSEFETTDARRLNLPAAQPYFSAWEAEYTAAVHEKTPTVLGFSLGKPAWLPADWLYTMPRTTVYTRRTAP